MNSGGDISGRVLAIWPNLIKVGPNSSIASRRWTAAVLRVTGCSGSGARRWRRIQRLIEAKLSDERAEAVPHQHVSYFAIALEIARAEP